MSTYFLWLAQVALIKASSYVTLHLIMLNLSLYILDIVGKHKHSVPLTYSPNIWNAVCCNADYIFVAGIRGDVHIHTWMGLHIQTLPLNLYYIRAIQCSHDGTVLQLATISSMHAYKVSYINSQLHLLQ